MNGNCLLFVGMLIVLGMCRELSSADGPAQAPPAAKLIVENAVRKVKQHVRIYEEARNKTLEDAKSRLSDEVARLGEQKKTEEVLAVSQIIKTLALTVEQRAKAPIHLATTGPPSMKEWVIGRWTGERTPHTFSFI
jgi:dissimilatory sulfite reductase (desulfoviridin) alpha/beta subunit